MPDDLETKCPPSPPPRGEVTELLLASQRGDTGAVDGLVQHLYLELRRVARGQLARHARQTLDPTGLLHEAYLKMIDHGRVPAETRGHFYSIAANAMRQVLVDRARAKATKKRGSGRPHTGLGDNDAANFENPEEVLAVEQAMQRLAEFDERLPKVVECRYFAGLTAEETAEALGTSKRTVHRDWQRARAWLLEYMA